MLTGRSYESVYQNFQWRIPRHYNIGADICDKWAHGKKRLALIHVGPDDEERRYSFQQLKTLSNRLANTLKANGIQPSDRVAILLPQCPEALIAHIAIYKLGALALPLLTLFGPLALEYRLNDCSARCVITDNENLPKLLELRDSLPNLSIILAIGSNGMDGVLDFESSIAAGSDQFKPVNTLADDPALVIYTSGTTGQPKGTLHAHRLLLGILPGFEFLHNQFPRDGDLLYTPLDWAYIGGSYDALFPSLHHGVPVLAFRPKKFDPEKALFMMHKYRVRNLMAVPTVLRIMMQAVTQPQQRYGIQLRSATVGGEPLVEALHAWCQRAFGVALNEQYGQTECDLVIGFCSTLMPIVKGAIGKSIPGHCVETIDEQGNPIRDDGQGEIAIKTPDPVMFKGYWNNPDATQKKFIKNWMRTGDYARKDAQGHFWFCGRQDDLIESGGYRIGPGEIEMCLMAHKAVAHACVLGVPDPVRGEIVKAFIVPKKGIQIDATVETDIRNFVKNRLEKHAYPREIEILEKMPLTKTGKINKAVLKKRSE
jgi:acetyl-CoA synthetase